MYFVYVLQSDIDPDRFYVGSSSDPIRRLDEHSSGKSVHTKLRPLVYAASAKAGGIIRLRVRLNTRYPRG